MVHARKNEGQESVLLHPAPHQEPSCFEANILLACCVKLRWRQDAHCCNEGDAPDLVREFTRDLFLAERWDRTGESHLRTKRSPNGIEHVSRAAV